jgi:hypothetical protein
MRTAARWQCKCGKATRPIRKTVPAQVEKLRERFGLKRLVLVGDRGMITSARIREDFSGDSGINLDHGVARHLDTEMCRARNR